MEYYARNIIFFLFERKREGYKRHADCTVVLSVVNCKSLSRERSDLIMIEKRR